MDTWEPDIFDLIEWASEHEPELLKAIHYVQDQYTPLLTVWRERRPRHIDYTPPETANRKLEYLRENYPNHPAVRDGGES